LNHPFDSIQFLFGFKNDLNGIQKVGDKARGKHVPCASLSTKSRWIHYNQFRQSRQL